MKCNHEWMTRMDDCPSHEWPSQLQTCSCVVCHSAPAVGIFCWVLDKNKNLVSMNVI